VAEATPGQAPAQPAIPESLNPHEAAGILSQMLESGQIQESGEAGEIETPTPRNEKGQFTKAEEPKSEEAKPETEATEEKVETPEEVKPEPRKFKLKYLGEEKEVDEPETIELAQKGYDYTQKMQQLSKEREELSAKVRTEQETAKRQYESQLELYRKYVESLAGVEQVDLNKLAAEDPTRAQQEFFKQLKFHQALQSIATEQQKFAQQRDQELGEARIKRAKEAVEVLSNDIPGWSNDLYGKILKTGVDTYGFKAEEVNAIDDPRAIKVLNDARQWREYQAAKPKTVDKKVQASAPKVQKPGSGEKPDPNANKIKEGMARLTKTGKRQDAVDLVREMIEQGQI